MRDRSFRRKAKALALARIRRSRSWSWVFALLTDDEYFESGLYRMKSRSDLHRYIGVLVSCHGVIGHDTWNKGEARKLRDLAKAKAEIAEVRSFVNCPVSL